ASSCYLAGRNEDVIEPAIAFDGTGAYFGPPEHQKLKAQWTFSDSRARFPSKVIYRRDGKPEYPSAYQEGFVDAIFEVQSYTNFNGLKIPRSSTLKIFDLKTNAMASDDLKLLVEYRVELTKVAGALQVDSFQPVIPGMMTIQDARSGHR